MLAHGAGAGAAIGQLVTLYLILPRKVRRLHSQQSDPAFPFAYSWDADAVYAEGKSGNLQRPWKNYHKWKENDHIILLYHSDNLFEMLPKRWFNDAEQRDEFRGCCRTRRQNEHPRTQLI